MFWGYLFFERGILGPDLTVLRALSSELYAQGLLLMHEGTRCVPKIKFVIFSCILFACGHSWQCLEFTHDSVLKNWGGGGTWVVLGMEMKFAASKLAGSKVTYLSLYLYVALTLKPGFNSFELIFYYSV